MQTLRPTLVALATVIVLLVGLAGWFAGAQFDRLNSQQIVSQLVEAQQSESTLRVQLLQRNGQIAELRKALDSGGTRASATQAENLQRQLLRQQAELSDFQALTERDRRAIAQNERILNALAEPGARFLALSPADPEAGGVAYALVLENNRILLIASRLSAPPQGREYQLWLTRTDDPKMVNAGTVEPDDAKRAITEFVDSQLVSAVAEVIVTEEPVEGSKGPTGPKVFAGSFGEP
jgi:hypothetical protein